LVGLVALRGRWWGLVSLLLLLFLNFLSLSLGDRVGEEWSGEAGHT
jgi:hypothetical protein